MIEICNKLHASPIVSVHEYACAETRGTESRDQFADADEFVFVHRGIFHKIDSKGSHVVDSSQVVLFRKNEPYTISHIDSQVTRQSF